jgi:adenylate cyclase
MGYERDSLCNGKRQALQQPTVSIFSDELEADVASLVRETWRTRVGQVVPEAGDLTLGNDRVTMDAVLLYADLADSTELALKDQEVAAEVFKAYLRGVTKIIKKNGGDVRSFDGDRVMGVFLGDTKHTSAATCGLQINWFFREVLTLKFKSFYVKTLNGIPLNQTVGIDRSTIHVVRAGVRVDNDLIWVGRAPNIAAKLSSLRDGNYNTFISKVVYDSMLDSAKLSTISHVNMWDPLVWEAGRNYGVFELYGSKWWWKP